VFNAHIEFGANKIIIEPKGAISLLRAPLIVTEYNHRNRGPCVTTACSHFIHRNTERTVPGKTHDRKIRAANLCTQDRWESIATRTEHPRSEVLAPAVEVRVSVANSAIVPDIGANNGVPWQGLFG